MKPNFEIKVNNIKNQSCRALDVNYWIGNIMLFLNWIFYILKPEYPIIFALNLIAIILISRLSAAYIFRTSMKKLNNLKEETKWT